METRRRYYPGGRVGGAARHGVRFSRSADDVDKARHEEVVGKSPHSARWQVGLVATQRTRHRRRRVQQVPSVVASNGNSNKLLRPEGGETICPPPTTVRRWQKSRRIYVCPRTGPQSAHLWWLAVAKLQAASVPIAEAAAPWDIQTDGSRYSKMPPRAGA